MAFTNPKENLAELNLNSAMRIADLGAGSGAYSLLAAKELSEGKVYALDIQGGLLDKLKNEANERGISNIEIIKADLETEHGTNLSDNIVDAVIVSNLLFLIENKDIFVKEVKRILRPGGEVLVVDWSDSFGGLGPQSENVYTEDKAKELFKDNGFEIKKNLYNAGEHHYGFIAKLSQI